MEERLSAVTDTICTLSQRLGLLRLHVEEVETGWRADQASLVASQQEASVLRAQLRTLQAAPVRAPPPPVRGFAGAPPAAAAAAAEPAEEPPSVDAVDWNLVPGSSAALAPADGPGAALISQKVRQIMLSGDGGIQISFGQWDKYYVVLEPGNEPGGRALRGVYRNFSAYGFAVKDCNKIWRSHRYRLPFAAHSRSARFQTLEDALTAWYKHFGLDAPVPHFHEVAHRW